MFPGRKPGSARRSLALALLGLAALLASALLLASCATSRGSTYSDQRSAEARAAETARGAPSSGAAGNGAPSSGGGPALQFSPPAQGSLSIRGLSPDSQVYLDGGSAGGSELELNVGRHELRVTRFGFRDFVAQVYIDKDSSTEITVEYLPAPFELLGLEAAPPSFNPRDPGPLGSTRLLVRATAPGQARLTIRGAGDSVLRDLGELGIASADAGFRWDGRDDSGALLPAGAYLARVEARGPDGTLLVFDSPLAITDRRYLGTSSLYSGLSGLLLAPDAETLGSGRLEGALGASLRTSPGSGGQEGLATLHAGFRYGLPAALGRALELDGSLLGVRWLEDSALDSYSATFAVKWGIVEAQAPGPLAAALFAKVSLDRFVGEDPNSFVLPSWDGATRYGGLSLGLPLQFASGRFKVLLAPELELSNYYPGWAALDAPWSAPGAFAWAYARLGLELIEGDWTVGLSAAPRSLPFDGSGKLALGLPLPLGLEFTWHSTRTPLALGLALTGEIDGPADYSLGAGSYLSYTL